MRRDLTIPDDAEPGRYGVYALLDEEGEPLYIGLTQNLFQRLKAHRNIQPWWHRVHSLEWTACDGSTEARAVEKSMIATFHPDANVTDARPLPRHSKQRVPDWIAAKLVELLEAEKAGAARDRSADRDRLNCYIAALRAAGWRLEPIGLPMNMTRERVRQRQVAAPSARTTFSVVAPPPKLEPVKRVKPSIPTATLAKMKPLQADARRVNGLTPLDSPLRVASERYSEMLAEQYLRGVSIYRISKQLGVTPLAIKARLARHGYLEPIKGHKSNTPYGLNVHPCLRVEIEDGAA